MAKLKISIGKGKTKKVFTSYAKARKFIDKQVGRLIIKIS